MYLEVFKHQEMFDLRLKTPNGNKKKIMTEAFSSYTLTWKLGLMHLKAKPQQDRCR